MSETHTLREVIGALRAVDAGGPTFGLPQLRQVVDDIVSLVPLHVTVRAPALAGYTEADVLELADQFGKHRARVMKEKLTKYPTRSAEDTGMLPGLQPTAEETISLRDLPRGKWPRWAKQMWPDGLPGGEPEVVLPMGYERSATQRRDISKSVRAILAKPVEEAELIRFAARHLSAPRVDLAADHVLLVHWFALAGLSDKLLEVGGLTREETGTIVPDPSGSSNAPLAGVLVQAYDLLDVARADAVEAMVALATMEEVDFPTIAHLSRKARWLAPLELSRLEALVKGEQASASPSQVSWVHSRLRHLHRMVQAAPEQYTPGEVEQLNSAHVSQILSASGLPTDEAEDKAVIAELRTRLTEMGLVNDLDQEIPAGLRAYHEGKLEEFYASRQARVDGDPDWERLYEELPEKAQGHA
jgi:hypothetical protein